MSDAVEPEMPVALAATVLVLRDAPDGLEVLLLRRAKELAFHGGAWVFPGGRVDPSDVREGEDALTTARRAAVRETREEAGLSLEPAQLVPVSHWTTPRGRPRRFATWFFATAPSPPFEVAVDGGEISAHRWLRASDALEARARGELDLPPPTFVTLWQLTAFAHTEALLSWLRAREPEVFLPRPKASPEGVLSLYEGDVAYEGGELEQPGPRHRLSMLPSGWRYEKG